MKSLSKDTVLVEIAKRLKELREKEITLLQELKNAPQNENLRVAKKKNSFQFYLVDNKDNPNGKYLSVKTSEDKKVIHQLAQRDYNEKILRKVQKDIKALEKTAATYSGDNLSAIYNDLHPGKKSYVTPLRLPDEDYVQCWQNAKYEGKPFAPDAPELYTAKGIRVRSKSEILIADTLYRLGIPFHYEFPVPINGLGKVYPDFLCLNVRTGKEFLWEHFGMMDDQNYAANAVSKLEKYQQNGFFPGKALIISMETLENPLNTKTIEKLIGEYLK